VVCDGARETSAVNWTPVVSVAGVVINIVILIINIIMIWVIKVF
jgi:hypothetical protein